MRGSTTSPAAPWPASASGVCVHRAPKVSELFQECGQEAPQLIYRCSPHCFAFCATRGHVHSASLPRGADLVYDYCSRHGLPCERVGKLIVACTDAEVYSPSSHPKALALLTRDRPHFRPRTPTHIFHPQRHAMIFTDRHIGFLDIFPIYCIMQDLKFVCVWLSCLCCCCFSLNFYLMTILIVFKSCDIMNQNNITCNNTPNQPKPCV